MRCHPHSRLTCLTLTIAVAVCCGFAQTSTPTSHVDVVVKDASGKTVTSLSKDDFLLFDHGEPQPIRNVSAVDTPWDIVLLFDHNLTWLQTDTRSRDPNYVVNSWSRLARSVDQFTAHMKPQDRIAIAAFEDKVDLLLDWRNAKTGKIQEVRINPVLQRPTGLKDLHGAIGWAINKLQGAKGRKAVIIFSDGRDGRLAPQWFTNNDHKEVFDPLFGLIDSGEAEEFLKTTDKVRSSGVRLYFLAINTQQSPDFHGWPINSMFPGAKDAVADYVSRVRLRLEKLAEISDGCVFYGDSPDLAFLAYEQLYDGLALGDTYTLEYSSDRNDDAAPRPEIRLRGTALKPQYLGMQNK